MKRRELADYSSELGFTPRDAVRWLSPLSLARTGLKVAAATVFADFGDKRELEAGLPGDPLRLDRLPVPGQPAQPTVVEKELPAPAALPGRAAASPENVGTPADIAASRPFPAFPPASTPAADAGSQDLWIDFTADLGDGFDATYSVALLLAEGHLSVSGHELRQGNILVLGGDEVYPVASPAHYEDRMAGPYRAASSSPPVPFGSEGSPGGPHSSCPPATIMLALPGNHDWYDGLTSFIRVFTRQRTIGRWRTVQTRSYFGVRLSGGGGKPGWWLVGLDSQLGQYIDEPQLDYFYRTVTTQLEPGDAIILCVATPSWIYSDSPTAPAFRQVSFFEQDYLRRRYVPETGLFEETGASVRLWLSGDVHHYSRFESEDDNPAARTQLVTCGLGGAYLSDTHWLPEKLVLPHPTVEPTASAGSPSSGAPAGAAPPPLRGDADDDGLHLHHHHAAAPSRPQSPAGTGRLFRRTEATYPEPAHGRMLGWRLANPFSLYWLPARNPGFGTVLGLIHVVIFLIGWTFHAAAQGQSLMASLEASAASGLLLPVLAFIAAPLLLLAALAAWLRWHRSRSSAATNPGDTGHATHGGESSLVTGLRGALYQAAALGITTTLALVVADVGNLASGPGVAVVLTLVFLSGWALGSEAFALFVIGTDGGEVSSWTMSGQAIEEHKGFLRMHLKPDGTLTLYPVAVDAVCHDWTLERTTAAVRPVPASGQLPEVRLLEEPITIAREGSGP